MNAALTLNQGAVHFIHDIPGASAQKSNLVTPTGGASSLLEPSVEALSIALSGSTGALDWRWARDLAFTARWTHSNWRGRIPGLGAHLLYVVHAGFGSLLLQSSNTRHTSRIRRGTLISVPVGTTVDVDLNGEVDCSQVLICETLMDACLASARVGVRQPLHERIEPEDQVMLQLVGMLNAEPRSDSCDWLFAKHLSLLLCAHLMRGRPENSAPSNSLGLTSWQLRKVREYMQANLHKPIGLNDISTVTGLTRYHFCTAFRQATGVTPYEYLTLLRIERAKELLASSRKSVAQISMLVGYGTPSAFTARFRRVVGLAPRAFRMSRCGVPEPND